MKNQTYRMTMLFDFYGDILTPRQRELFDLYYNEDLSLAEIAENCGISRQGVRDVIVGAEAYLTEIEDKTGLIRRFHTMQAQLKEVEGCAHSLLELNAARFEDDELEALGKRLEGLAETLIQE